MMMVKHTPDDAANCECAGSSLHGIKMCPLHAAAPALLEALEFAAYDAHMANDHPYEYTTCLDERCVDRRHAINAARGGDHA